MLPSSDRDGRITENNWNNYKNDITASILKCHERTPVCDCSVETWSIARSV
ncbi:MAG: hypothetical protein ACOC1Z_05265 [Cyanobacteriota bacterium]